MCDLVVPGNQPLQMGPPGASHSSIRRSVLLSVVCLLLSASSLASQQRVLAIPTLSLYAKLMTCAPGYYMNGAGGCSIAPAGSYSTGGTSTSSTPCAPGSFSSNPGQSFCVLALAGTYVAGSSGTASIQCAAGNYQPSAGQSSCIAASIGFFVSTTAATSQTQCAIGMTTNAVGSTLCVAIPPVAGYDALITAAQTTPGVAGVEATKLVNNRTQLVAGKNSQACKAVDSFMSYVTGESGKKISAANANMLLYKSQEAKIAMGC